MKNRLEVKIRPEHLEDIRVNEDYIYRSLAMRMIKEMPMDELRKLIEFTKTDPNSEHSKRVLCDKDCPDWQKGRIHQLRDEGVILYEAECDLP